MNSTGDFDPSEADLAEMQAAQDAYDEALWSQEQAQTLWAERGGYCAGLSRPGRSMYARPAPATEQSMKEDLPF